MRYIAFAVMSLFTVVVCANAEQITIGENPRITSFSRAVGSTVINAEAGASASGSLSVATFKWTSWPCPGSVKIKFVRLSGGTLHLVAERGPFTATGINTRVTLDPPVELLAGDLIGYSGTGEFPCGAPQTSASSPDRSTLSYGGDLTADVSVSLVGRLPGYVVPVFATNNPDYTVRTDIVPAVASLTGLFGAQFESELQMQAVLGAARGRIIYHPELVSGSSGDRSIAYDLSFLTSTTFRDIMATLGVTGKGSLDITTDLGFQPPGVTARVFERSSAGTKGFSVRASRVEQAVPQYQRIIFITPSDGVHFRMNLGVRTLQAGATIEFDRYASDGTFRGGVTRSYPAEYFAQDALANLLGSSYGEGDLIIPYIQSGSAILYTSTIDNDTNDPSIDLPSGGEQ